jgi:hypothetical protein
LTPPPPSGPDAGGPPPPPAIGAGGGHPRWAEMGWGVNILEDARHSSVLYICKYFGIDLIKYARPWPLPPTT